MQVARALDGTFISSVREALEHRRIVPSAVLVMLILIWAKIVPALGLAYPSALIPLCAMFIALVLLSAPLAAALFFLGNYYFGNLSILYYPRISFLSVLAVLLVVTMICVRWRRGELGRFLRLSGRVYMALAGLALFFLVGYMRAVWQLHLIEFEQTDPQSLSTAFQESLRGSNELSHYMLLSHWLGFLAIGMLACMSYDEFKVFFLSLSVLFVVQLLSIPLSYYPEFFRNVYMECQPLGLGYAQVNRAYLGYMAALAGGLALTVSHENKPVWRAALLAWWTVLSLVVVLSGSRGPAIAWILVTAYVVWRNWHVARGSYRVLFAALLSVSAVSAISGISVLPCGTLSKLGEARYSLESRSAHIKDLFASYLGTQTGSVVLLPSGESHRMNAEDVVRYQAGETAYLYADRKNIRVRPGYTDVGVMTWLFGKGFGGSQRSIDAAQGQLRSHAGSMNLALDLFTETGLAGLSLFVASIVLLWLGLRKAIADRPHPDSRWLVTGLVSVMIVLLVKVSIAADTPGEDLAGLAIGLLIGAIGVATTGARDNTAHEISRRDG